MEVKTAGRVVCNPSSATYSTSSSIINNNQSDQEDMMDLRRGPWTVEEDLTLINYIAKHGEGRWNSLARCAGLNRTGKSCRLRWLNYLRPDVRRGNITLEEQLLILELHSRWGNRWSKIAQHLPGRTDNEIKNYWRTRVQKHAKQLKCDVNSKQFKDTMRYLWMPRLVERIQAAGSNKNDVVNVPTVPISTSSLVSNITTTTTTTNLPFNNCDTFQNVRHVVFPNTTSHVIGTEFFANNNTTDNSSTAGSSDSFGTQVSPVSDLTELYCTTAIPVDNNNNPNQDYNYQVCYPDTTCLTSPVGNYFSPGLDYQAMELNNNHWLDGGDTSDNLWNVEDLLLLPQQFYMNNTF